MFSRRLKWRGSGGKEGGQEEGEEAQGQWSARSLLVFLQGVPIRGQQLSLENKPK